MKLRHSLLILVSFCSYGNADPINFDSKASLKQVVDLAENSEVSLLFSCRSLEVLRRDVNAMTLEIQGKNYVRGYWGSLEDSGARQLTSEELEFYVSKSDNTIRVKSPEYHFMHDGLVVEKINVTIPYGLIFKVECLTPKQLELQQQ